MSAIRHFLGALPAGRRSYSSFFSSKPGGGRYFNAAKPKPAVVAAKSSSSKSDSSAKQGEQSTTTTTTTTTTAATPNAAKDGMDSNANPTTSTVADTRAVTVTTAAGSSSSSPTDSVTPEIESSQLVHPVEDYSIQSPPHFHPVLSSNDFKLHQFFSLHRPLLLVRNSNSLFTSGPSLESIFSSNKLKEEQQPQQPLSVFDSPADASIDADAEAARQLARGLTMNKAGPAVSWEETLKRLGLDPSRDPERVNMQEQMDKDWQDVQILLDSTKRKRRKKMKKHKLKKRRKATRSSRLKLK